MKTWKCCRHCEQSSCRPRYWNAMLVRPPRNEHPWACLLCDDNETGRQAA